MRIWVLNRFVRKIWLPETFVSTTYVQNFLFGIIRDQTQEGCGCRQNDWEHRAGCPIHFFFWGWNGLGPVGESRKGRVAFPLLEKMVAGQFCTQNLVANCCVDFVWQIFSTRNLIARGLCTQNVCAKTIQYPLAKPSWFPEGSLWKPYYRSWIQLVGTEGDVNLKTRRHDQPTSLPDRLEGTWVLKRFVRRIWLPENFVRAIYVVKFLVSCCSQDLCAGRSTVENCSAVRCTCVRPCTKLRPYLLYVGRAHGLATLLQEELGCQIGRWGAAK